MLTDAQTGSLKGMEGKRAAIVGIGVTNVPLIRFLAAHGVQITACDQKQEDSLISELRALAGLDVRYLLGPGYLDALPSFDIVYLSPGVNPGQPEIEAARRAGVAISSEIDLVLRLSAAPTVGIPAVQARPPRLRSRASSFAKMRGAITRVARCW